MFQVRIHGRGGQGVVTAAEMLSIAAFLEDRTRRPSPASAPSAPARRWWPSAASTTSEIRLREPVLKPDALIIQDPTLLHQVDVFAGLVPRRLHPDQHLAQLRRARGRRFRARLARRSACAPCRRPSWRCKHVGRPLPNAALLGGFAAVAARMSLDSVAEALGDKFSGKVAEGNVAAAREAYELVRQEMQGGIGHAQAD